MERGMISLTFHFEIPESKLSHQFPKVENESVIPLFPGTYSQISNKLANPFQFYLLLLRNS